MIAGLAGRTAQAVQGSAGRARHRLSRRASVARRHEGRERRRADRACARPSRAKFPLVGFYLQPAVGGIVLPASFWRRFAAIENVVAIKIAPFNRYRTLDVVRGVVEAGAERPRHALYRQRRPHRARPADAVHDQSRRQADDRAHQGRPARPLERVGQEARSNCWSGSHAAAGAAQRSPIDLLALDSQVTDCNAAIFDVANDFHGVIAGCHEILRRQGLLEGIWCLDPNETLGPGQKEEIDRVYAAYPHLNDDAFVRAQPRTVAVMMPHARHASVPVPRRCRPCDSRVAIQLRGRP